MGRTVLRFGAGGSGPLARASAVAVLSAFLLMSAARPVLAGVPSPTITGSIGGAGQEGRILTITIHARVPGGGDSVNTVQAVLLLHSVILDQVVIDRRARTVSTPSSLPVALGSQQETRGMFLAVAGRDAVVRTTGDALTATIRARVVQDLPAGAQFSLAVITLSQVARVLRPVTVPSPGAPPAPGGFPWRNVGLAVVAALFFGAFVGNLFASRYRIPPKLDVYGLISRHMAEERPGAAG